MDEKSIQILLAALVLSCPVTTSGQGLETFYGPERFVHSTWKPVAFSRTVSLKDHQPPYVLHVRNGAADGRMRLILGSVKINGQQVIGPGDLWSHEALHEVVISPTDPFRLQVCFFSRPRTELTIWIEGARGVPPDPATVAPLLDQTIPTQLASATRFLYTGPNPIQKGVAEGTIEVLRAAVLRGRALALEGAPLPGVTITVLGHPEFGSTLTRADGMFDLAVNGGSALTVQYEKTAYLPAQRTSEVPWQDYAWLPAVTLIPLDPQATRLEFSANAPAQVARGSLITDDHGARQATVLSPAGGSMVSMELPGGGILPALSSLTLRATEYTVGPSGPAKMPAELPPTSAYTYAVEVSADEALQANATRVTFDPPLALYLENFLGFPTGGAVPTGYYDQGRGAWCGSPNGRVVKILEVLDGGAVLDVTGTGAATPEALAALGIGDAERGQLATLYAAGQTLWRVPLQHLTPFDCNWPLKLPEDAEPPEEEPKKEEGENDPCARSGNSIVECQNQTLRERVRILGTPFTLNYRSDRAAGRSGLYTVEVPLGRNALPTSLKRIDLRIGIAGQRLERSFPPEPDQVFTFTWDGRDAYGRPVQGWAPALVSVDYVYDGVYTDPDPSDPSFAAASPTPLLGEGTSQPVPVRGEGRRGREWRVPLGLVSGSAAGLGGWTLSAHHTYEAGTLYLGDGRQRRAGPIGSVISTLAGTGIAGYTGDGGPALDASIRFEYRSGYASGMSSMMAVAPDGTVYFTQGQDHAVRAVAADGTIGTIAGTGAPGYGGDGGPASAAQLRDPGALATGPDGSLYISDAGNWRVRRIRRDGIITTVAGNGELRPFPGVPVPAGYRPEGDGGPATDAALAYVVSISVARDGTLALGEMEWVAGHLEPRSFIRRVSPCGLISTMASNGSWIYGSEGPALEMGIQMPAGIAWGPDGSLYVADLEGILRVAPDGILSRVAGGGSGSPGDGGLATDARLSNATAVAVGGDGTLYISESLAARVRRVAPNGIISTFVGGCDPQGAGGCSEDGGPALGADLRSSQALALSPDGSLLVADTADYRIRRVSSPLPNHLLGSVLVASEDGREVYEFDASGRHLTTRHALTGAVLHEFAYDGSGRLADVQDGAGNVTRIERDAAGDPVAIVSPLGQRTQLSLGTNGYLQRITNPAGESVLLVYTASGLLLSLEDPRGLLRTYAYDEGGRLTSARAPDGGTTLFARARVPGGFEVAETSAAGRQSLFRVERLGTGATRSLNASGAGRTVLSERLPDGRVTIAASDGTTWASKAGADPRFGLQSPFTESLTMQTPAGLIASQTQARTATLGDAANPLSLTSSLKSLTVNGRVVTTAFDAVTRTLRRTLPSGRAAEMVLDLQGRPLLRSAFSLTPTAYEYDTAGRLVTLRRGDRSVRLGYDGQGYLSTIVDTFSRQTRLEHDLAGRITARNTPDDRTFRYAYDRQGNLTSLTLPSGATNVFTYNARGLLDSHLAPGAATPLRREYDLDGRLLSISLPDSRTIERSYDGKGRLARVAFDRGAILRQYDDASGRLARLVAPDGGSLDYRFDGSLLTGRSWAGVVSGTVAEVYDSSLRPVGRVINGQDTASLGYDSDGFLVFAGDLSIVRAPDTGLVTSTTLGNVTTSHAYTSLGEPRETRVRVDGVDVYGSLLLRDPAGRIVEKTETWEGASSVTRYRYDEAGRLVEAVVDGATTLYQYDTNGNRTLRQSETESWPASFAPDDRVTAMGPYAYSHGPAGDLRQRQRTDSGEVTTYSYEATGALVSVSLPGGRQVEYVLDAIGRRIGRRVNGTLLQGFLYKDRLRPAAELSGAGSVGSLFVYGERSNVPSYMVRDGRQYRIVSDHLGSPRVVIEVGSGAIVQRMEYDEFGRVRVDTSPGFQPFGFAGGLYDPDTGLVRFGERDYDPETGRWTTKDRRLFAGRTENLYAYVSNDPLNRVDRWGRAECYLGPTAGVGDAEYCDEVPPGTYEEDCNDPEDHCQQVGRNADGSYQDDWSIDGGTAGESVRTTCDEDMVTCTTESRFIDDQSEGNGPPPDGRSAEDDLDEEMRDDLERRDQERKNGDGAGPNPCP